MNRENIVLQCSDIRKSYSLDKSTTGELQVLKGVELEVRYGEFITIVGASGSGKSTLLHILGGLDRPSSGDVCWGEYKILSLHDNVLASLRSHYIGLVFQFHHLMQEFTALENVMIPQMIARVSKSDARSRAQELMAKVGLPDRMHHRPNELSGGEQQRVAVARALANSPNIILADEPSGNLDSSSSEKLYELLLELNEDEGQTFIVVTHNEQYVARSGRTLRMVDGKLLEL